MRYLLQSSPRVVVQQIAWLHAVRRLLAVSRAGPRYLGCDTRSRYRCGEILAVPFADHDDGGQTRTVRWLSCRTDPAVQLCVARQCSKVKLVAMGVDPVGSTRHKHILDPPLHLLARRCTIVKIRKKFPCLSTIWQVDGDAIVGDMSHVLQNELRAPGFLFQTQAMWAVGRRHRWIQDAKNIRNVDRKVCLVTVERRVRCKVCTDDHMLVASKRGLAGFERRHPVPGALLARAQPCGAGAVARNIGSSGFVPNGRRVSQSNAQGSSAFRAIPGSICSRGGVQGACTPCAGFAEFGSRISRSVCDCDRYGFFFLKSVVQS